jgi:hypothetical protein
MVEKSHEFSYTELSIATNKFSMSNKIGEGGFGEVFYAELRGQVCYPMHDINGLGLSTFKNPTFSLFSRTILSLQPTILMHGHNFLFYHKIVKPFIMFIFSY